MPNFIKQIFSGSTEGILNGASNLIDNLVTNKEERGKLKNEFTALVTDYAKTQEQQVTERLKADMTSDSWLSKNVRPLTLIFTTAFIIIFAFTDGNIGQFSIDKSYIELFKALLLVQYSFYFGSRAFNKAIKLRGK